MNLLPEIVALICERLPLFNRLMLALTCKEYLSKMPVPLPYSKENVPMALLDEKRWGCFLTYVKWMGVPRDDDTMNKFFEECGEHRLFKTLERFCEIEGGYWAIEQFAVCVIEGLTRCKRYYQKGGNTEPFLEDCGKVLSIMWSDGYYVVDGGELRSGQLIVEKGRKAGARLRDIVRDVDRVMWGNLQWMNSNDDEDDEDEDEEKKDETHDIMTVSPSLQAVPPSLQ